MVRRQERTKLTPPHASKKHFEAQLPQSSSSCPAGGWGCQARPGQARDRSRNPAAFFPMEARTRVFFSESACVWLPRIRVGVLAERGTEREHAREEEVPPKSALQVEGAVGAMPAGSGKDPRRPRAGLRRTRQRGCRQGTWRAPRPSLVSDPSTDLTSAHAGEAPGIPSVPGGSGEMRSRERERLPRSSV